MHLRGEQRSPAPLERQSGFLERADAASSGFEIEPTPPVQRSRETRHRQFGVRERADHGVEVYASRRSSSCTSNLPMVFPSSSSRSAVSSETPRMNGDFISVGEALKLVPPFNGNKQEVLSFIWIADTAFAVINPSQEAILCKFVLTRISGEPRTAFSHRNLNKWAELRVSAKRLHRETNPRFPCESTV